MRILKKYLNLKILKNTHINKNFFLIPIKQKTYLSKLNSYHYFNFDKFCFINIFNYPNFNTFNILLIRFYKYYLYNVNHYKLFNFKFLIVKITQLYLYLILKIKIFSKFTLLHKKES